MRSDGVGNLSTVASTNEAVDMTSTPNVEVIRTSLVSKRREGFFKDKLRR